ncbi:hypothetical protein [Pseudomonas sp. 008]|uniref:hypothetical protein n=1 Tax=Pseudomonas sp. 008 TaxID=2803906 RepID=UPI00194F95D7|nr:hypothetical protein [Pseudomonas sp. 008]GID03221.1 hypothetical protein TMM008_04230 [Pseudomonas sp. 008]
MSREKSLIWAERACSDLAKKLALSFSTRQKSRGIINSFWFEISRNALDLAVLEWCHLFGQRKDALHWSKVLSGTENFKAHMLSAIEISEEKWEEYWSQIKVYRDKDLAHIEARNISMIPSMEIAINSTAFYYSKIQYALAELGRAPQRQMSFFDILDVYTKQFEQQAEIALIATGTLRNA